MSNDKPVITTIYITKEHQQQMEMLAKQWGYYQTRGAGAGKMGSISQLITAIAAGSLTIKPANSPDPKPQAD
jgi:hypothetical protein